MPDEADKSGEQKAAEAEVRSFEEGLGPFVIAAETTRMPMVFTDAKEVTEPIIFANESFLALFRYSQEKVLGKSLNLLFALEPDGAAAAQIGAMLKGRSHSDPELCFRRGDGSLLWASFFISPVLDRMGNVVQHFASFVDRTEHRQQQERLEFLLAELNHRTQNTLAIVRTIAQKTLRGLADDELVNKFDGRIMALAQVHSLLGTGQWAEAGIREILVQILQPFNAGDRPEGRFSMEGDDVRLQPQDALALAMIFQELATNALKYGALSNPAGGRIKIAWQIQTVAQDDQLRLRWQESGGPPVTRPSRRGFGSQLLNLLAHQLDGEAHPTYGPEGVVVDLVVRVPKRRENAL